MENREIEAKFLEIDKDALIAKLRELGAQDLGEDLLREIIFYDQEGKWVAANKTFVRIRQRQGRITLTYKNQEAESATGTEEIEFGADSWDKARQFLEALGLRVGREQEKKRHTFALQKVTVDIDTWPSVPTYVELEGESEEKIRQAAALLGFDWGKAVFGNSGWVLEKYYHIPVRSHRYFTFARIE